MSQLPFPLHRLHEQDPTHARRARSQRNEKHPDTKMQCGIEHGVVPFSGQAERARVCVCVCVAVGEGRGKMQRAKSSSPFPPRGVFLANKELCPPATPRNLVFTAWGLQASLAPSPSRQSAAGPCSCYLSILRTPWSSKSHGPAAAAAIIPPLIICRRKIISNRGLLVCLCQQRKRLSLPASCVLGWKKTHLSLYRHARRPPDNRHAPSAFAL